MGLILLYLLKVELEYGDTIQVLILDSFYILKNGPIHFETKVLDAAEGSIPKKLVRTIYSGFVMRELLQVLCDEGNVKSADPITEIQSLI